MTMTNDTTEEKQEKVIEGLEEAISEKKQNVSAEQMSDVFSHIDIPITLKNSVRLLLLSEQNNILTSVLKRLNGDKEMWEKAQKDPVLLLSLITQEQQESMNALQRHIGAELQKRKEEK